MRAWTAEGLAQVMELHDRSWSQARIARMTGFTRGQIAARFRAIKNNKTPGGKPYPGTPSPCPPRIRDLIEQKSFELGFSPNYVLSDDRSHVIAQARGDVMRHVRESVIMADGRPPSYPQIGRWFGRDHSSVIAAVKKSRERANAL